MTATLSVVMPVHNEAPHLPSTLDALVAAIDASGFEADLVLVDDGSTDDSAAVVRSALDGRLPLEVVSGPKRGRFAARRAGIQAARAQYVLLLDARVRIEGGSLAFIEPKVEGGDSVWASHVDVEDGGNPLGVFMRLLAELAWSDYFDDPRTTSFGLEDFDRFPKGTGCLFAPRDLLLEALEAFSSRYADLRYANDDTLPLRWIAARTPIHVSPHYRSAYTPRTRLAPFLRHAYHRGIVFVDGHGRRESRFFPVAVAFYPASAIWALAARRRPSLVPLTVAGVAVAAATFAVARGRTSEEAAALALSTPVYAAAHGAGMWTGLTSVVRGRLLRTG